MRRCLASREILSRFKIATAVPLLGVAYSLGGLYGLVAGAGLGALLKIAAENCECSTCVPVDERELGESGA